MRLQKVHKNLFGILSQIFSENVYTGKQGGVQEIFLLFFHCLLDGGGSLYSERLHVSIRFCLLRDLFAEDADRAGDLSSGRVVGGTEHTRGGILDHTRAAGLCAMRGTVTQTRSRVTRTLHREVFIGNASVIL